MGKASKDKRDYYYRKAKEEGWRARSAFKLLQINEEFKIFENVETAVDLCAAPGSWSQVLSSEIRKSKNEKAKIVSVDLQPMEKIDGVINLQADITDHKTLEKILNIFEGKKVDLVCCDGAPDVTGMHDLDEYIQSQLVLTGLRLAGCILKKGGIFLTKIFRGKNIDLLYCQIEHLFEKVICTKPKASRGSSFEAFLVCFNFNDEVSNKINLNMDFLNDEFSQNLNLINNKNTSFEYSVKTRKIVDFISCGDLNDLDSDTTFFEKYKDFSESLDPVQFPTNPSYKTAIQLKRSNCLNNSKSRFQV